MIRYRFDDNQQMVTVGRLNKELTVLININRLELLHETSTRHGRVRIVAFWTKKEKE
jgi:hypothetical protein